MSRIRYLQVTPEPFKDLGAITKYLATASIDPLLRNLVEIRISQINGCVYCVDYHTKESRAHGETQPRLDQLPVWQEALLFTDRERAALDWSESVTHISQTHAPDDKYEALKAHFSEKEIVDLTMIISTINAWNRISIAFRNVPK
ncbi:MAG: carboxymuconolactone decarboxylase family protein [Chthoniobacterales bacterium]